MKTEDIQELKEDKDFVILAHYYVDGQVQEMADYVGDSFALAKQAREIEADKVIMAGVDFMGETIKILNPEKTVYNADPQATCTMAMMVSAEDIENMRKEVDDLAVVCYVNSTAEVKAHSDYCCTSANAKQIIQAIPEKNIYFVPDGNLANNLAPLFPDKNIIPHKGFCCVHNNILPSHVKAMKQAYPQAKVLAHPECRTEIMDYVDYKGSTSGMIQAVGEMDADEYIIITEDGIGWELKEKYPEKVFHFPEDISCKGMKQVSKDRIIEIMRQGGEEVHIDESLRLAAKKPLDRMMDIAAK